MAGVKKNFHKNIEIILIMLPSPVQIIFCLIFSILAHCEIPQKKFKTGFLGFLYTYIFLIFWISKMQLFDSKIQSFDLKILKNLIVTKVYSSPSNRIYYYTKLLKSRRQGYIMKEIKVLENHHLYFCGHRTTRIRGRNGYLGRGWIKL